MHLNDCVFRLKCVLLPKNSELNRVPEHYKRKLFFWRIPFHNVKVTRFQPTQEQFQIQHIQEFKTQKATIKQQRTTAVSHRHLNRIYISDGELAYTPTTLHRKSTKFYVSSNSIMPHVAKLLTQQ